MNQGVANARDQVTDGGGRGVPPAQIDGRDVELILAGAFSLVAAGAVVAFARGPLKPAPLVIFTSLGILSFALAWWDIRSRGGLSLPREE